MGALTASGSFARVCGPLFVTFVYNYFGLYVTFGIVEVLMLSSLILVLIFWRRMVPLVDGKDQILKENQSVTEPVVILSMQINSED
jgi:hypothetical protein